MKNKGKSSENARPVVYESLLFDIGEKKKGFLNMEKRIQKIWILKMVKNVS